MAIFNNKQLCPVCQTGKETYELDQRSPCCPYIACHNGTKCGWYKKIESMRNKEVQKQ